MSRVGRLPIEIPDDVTVSVEEKPATVHVEGPAGTLEQRYEPKYVEVNVDDAVVQVQRRGETKPHKARHGLYRSLIANMVQGVREPYERRLQLMGLGYRARMQGEQELVLEIGYSHPIHFAIPDGVEASVEESSSSAVQAVVVLKGPDKQLVGETAAEIRALRKPEPYKGTGIKYRDEEIVRKEGKLAGAGE